MRAIRNIAYTLLLVAQLLIISSNQNQDYRANTYPKAENPLLINEERISLFVQSRFQPVSHFRPTRYC